MSKLFMYGTPLEEIERLMVMVPDFQPRRSGIVINNYFNYGGDKGCSCNSADVRNKYNARSNTPFNARLNICEMEYGDLVRCSFGKIGNHSFKERIRHLINIFNGEIFFNPEHKERFYYVIYGHDLDICDISPRYIAVVFLVNLLLWK